MRRVGAGATGTTVLLAGCQGREEPTDATPSSTDETPTEPSATATGDDREYEPVDAEMDLGVRYVLDQASWSCFDREPAGGTYTGVDTAVVNRHVDQLRGFGVNRVVIPLRAPSDRARFERFRRAELADELAVEFRYPLPTVALSDRDVAADIEFLREQIQAENYTTQDGRPVLTIGLLTRFLADVEASARLRRALPGESVAAFLERIRTELTVDGTEPYLVAGMGLASPSRAIAEQQRYPAVFAAVDAVTNHHWRFDTGDEEWDRTLQRTRTAHAGLVALAEAADLDVLPLVFPGFDTVTNGCVDGGKRAPRAPEHLDTLLSLARSRATTDRVRVASFNDWRRGTQIEPGTADGDDYGTDYLDRVRAAVVAGVRDPADRSRYVVAPDGDDTGAGTADAPLATIQEALLRACPGATVEVRPGRYREKVTTVRDGRSDAPITVTGPPDAVFVGVQRGRSFEINHSHVHLTGLTFDGLIDPDAPDRRQSYAAQQITAISPRDGYLSGLRISPHAVGNVLGAAVNLELVEDSEVGGFRVTGGAGLEYAKFGDRDHNGEIVYVGTPPGQMDTHEVSGYDRTNGIRVHHVDNSAGYPHSELVNTKLGTYDVLVEYCTDAGGSQNNESYASQSIALQGAGATVRWCDLRNGDGDGIEIGSHNALDARQSGDPGPVERRGGTDNAVYGNRVTGFDGKAIRLNWGSTQSNQRVLCGNEYDGETDGDPDRACGDAVPSGDGIGHTGGDG